MTPLPIDPHIDRIRGALRQARAVVVTAAPGAGKTTRVPPALVADGRVILLQPRRVAARTIASRIASERAWSVGREVGWQVRFDRRFSASTALLVVTEGILTARLQGDPLLSDFRTIVLDEFHERSIHADLALALARQAWRARDDLRIVVMSATLDSGPVASFLDDCPVVDVPGRLHSVEIDYAPGQTVADAVGRLTTRVERQGQILCFLPGAGEIRRTIGELQRTLSSGVEVVPLHGSLAADEQDAAIAPTDRPRVIVATNIAETSLTVPGVTAVVDSGLHKAARYDPDRGIDTLETERISADSAEQRAGRAGRLAPGTVIRLWDRRDRLRPHREPEIERIDLSSAALDVIAWGGDPRTLEWFEAPRPGAIDAAIALLVRLGLVTADPLRLTAEGARAARMPVHPRLGRLLIAAGGSRAAARACAIVSERHLASAGDAATTSSDLLSALDRWDTLPPHVHRAAADIERAARGETPEGPPSEDSDELILRAALAAYPDRVARRRDAPGARGFSRAPLLASGRAPLLLATGTGAVLGRESGVRDAEYLVAIDVHLPPSHAGDAIVRMASAIDAGWLRPTSSEIVHRFDDPSGRVRAARVDRYDALVLAEHPTPPDPEVAAALLADAWFARERRDADARLLRRLEFAGVKVDLPDLVRSAAYGVKTLDDVDLAGALAADVRRTVDRLAPETLAVPSGRLVRLEYQDDGTVMASVKLQELFGLAETPRIGARHEPVLLSLLAPNGRPVQLTRDLRSFWDRTYPEVRKELRGRYPKHPWPEDPWTAPPTARTRRRSR